MRRGSRLAAIVAAAGIVLAAAAPSAAATTGAIEGVAVELSLAHAAVQNLSVNYDGCSAVGNPTCAWEASAWLVPPPAASCPSNGSGVSMASEDPPGFPGLLRRKVWEKESTGDGSAQSGPLLLSLEGVNDHYLCLYATHQPTYTAEFPQADLLASQLLHVEPPPLDSTAPDTKIFKSVLKRSPPIFVFHFHSTEPGSTFRCKLDRHPFTACTSSKRFAHLKPGRHVLEVGAVDTAGNQDLTPAIARFNVAKQTKPKHPLLRPTRRSETG